MAMKKTYFTINGDIIGEKTAGGSRVDYLTDALGSVIGTVNQSAQVVNTYRYKPYGAQLAKTGVGADPAFGWVGTHGYRPTERSGRMCMCGRGITIQRQGDGPPSIRCGHESCNSLTQERDCQ